MLLYQRLRPKTLDLYIIREVLPPTSLGLLTFTFVLLLDSIPKLLGVLVSRGADLVTIGRVFLNLLPSIFAVTIPMAFLLGVLLAFGRLASESELVAMRASGISPLRLLRPVLALCALTTGITFYVNAVALPDANQAYREHVFALAVSKAKGAVRARVFTDDLVPNMVVFISDISAETGQWKNILIKDVRRPAKPSLILARTGRLVIDKDTRQVSLGLEQGVLHDLNPATPDLYDQQRFGSMIEPLNFDEFFPKLPLAKGDREMRLYELEGQVEKLRAEGKPPKDYARFRVEWHKKFAIATACLVFGLLGLGLSLGSKKEARSAAFGLSIVVIFVYYVMIRMGEQAGDTGLMPPFLAMWGANLVLGGVAVVLIALNHKAAAFDPLDPRQYLALLPDIRRRVKAPAAAPPRAVGRRGPPGRGGRAAVVVRIPRMNLRFPTRLDRYVGRSYLGLFLLVLTAFGAVYCLAEFMDLFDDVQQNHVKGRVVFHFYAYHSFWIVHFLAPLAVLVAVLATFGILSRRNEVTAMKAVGVSVYRAALPVVVIALSFSCLLYVMQELVLPTTNRIAAQDFNVIKGRPPQSSGLLDRRWILGSDSRFYDYDYLSEKKHQVGLAEGREGLDFTLFGLRVYDVDPESWELRDVLQVAQATWNGQGYDLERGWRRGLLPRPAFHSFASARTRDLEPPSYFAREERPSDTMSFPELRRHIQGLEALGFDTLKLRVQLHRKVAFPLATVVMVLLGIPFSFVVGRRGALYGVATSLVIAIVYWAVLETFQALGENAILPPFLAAWAPNLIFAATGLYLLLNLET